MEPTPADQRDEIVGDKPVTAKPVGDKPVGDKTPGDAIPVVETPAGEMATNATLESPAAGTEQALLEAIDEIDYSAYESPELRASIESILSVPGTVIFFLRVAGLSFPFCQLLIMWVFRHKEWLTLGTAFVAGLIASLVLAVLLGITLSLRRILSESVKVIDMTLDIVGTVISDVGASGDQGLVKTTACVFGGVSRNLILPIVESVVRGQLGFFGRPLLWVYRRVFVKTVDAATNRILLSASKIQVPGRERLAPVGDAVGTRVKTGAETADWLLSTIRPYVVGGSRTLSWGVLLPAWILLGMVAAVIVAVFSLGYHFG